MKHNLVKIDFVTGDMAVFYIGNAGESLEKGDRVYLSADKVYKWLPECGEPLFGFVSDIKRSH